jgi:cobalt-zinc-cadmium efflux system outer membrane protein
MVSASRASIIIIALAALEACATPEPFIPDGRFALEPPPVAAREGQDVAHRGRIAQGLTLEEAQDLALRANPSILAMSEAVNAARARIVEAQVFTNPVFTFGKGEIPTKDGALTSDQRTDFKAWDLRTSSTSFALSKDFDISGKRYARIDAAEENEQQSEAQYASAALALRAQVRVAYAAVLVGERNLDLAREARDMAQRNHDIVRGRAEGGNALRADVLRARADADRAEIDVSQAERDLGRLRRALTTLLGDPEATLGPLRTDLPLATSVEDGDEGKLVQEALERNGDVIAARRAVRAAEANVRLQERSVVPDVTLQVQYNRYILDHNDTIGLQLGVPLPLFDQNRGQIAEATALLRQTQHQLATTERAIVQSVHDDVQALKVSRVRIARFESSIVPGYREAVALATASWEGGKVLYVDVIAARTAFNQTRSDYVNELLGYETTVADLERVLARTRSAKP